MDKASFRSLVRAHGRGRVAFVRQMRPVGLIADYRAAIVHGPLGLAMNLVNRFVVPALPHLIEKPSRIKTDATDTKKISVSELLQHIREAHAYDGDPTHGYAQATTKEIAESLGISPERALRLLQKAAKENPGLSRRGHESTVKGGKEASRGVSRGFGFQIWELPNRVKIEAAEAVAATVAAEAPELISAAASVGHVLDEARAAWALKYPRAKLAEITTPAAVDLARFQSFQLNRQLRQAVTVDVVGAEPWLPPVIEAFTQENVSLIKTIPNQFFDDLEKHLASELGDGVRFEALTETIKERYDVAANRAELIARDQAGKFFGDLNRVRQVDLGIEGAIWRGMLDNRERDEHIDREGAEFDWDTGIDGETPGQPVLCRCNGEPNLKPLLAD